MAAGEPIPSWINRNYGGAPRGGFSSNSIPNDPYHPNTTPDYSGGYDPQIPAEPGTGAPDQASPPSPPSTVGAPVGAAVGAQPPPPPPPPSAPVPTQEQIDAYNDILARQRAYSDTTNATNFFNAYRSFSGFDNQRDAMQRSLQRAQGQSGAYQRLGNAREANLQSQYGLANRAADLKLAAMGIDRNAIQDELANIGGQRGLAGTEREQELANIAARRGLSAKELQNQTTALGNKSRWDRWDINEASTGGGTWLSPGRGEKLGRVEKQLATDVEKANLGYQTQLQDYTANEQRTERGYQGKLLDLDFREKQANTRDQKLGLIADEVGIDRDQARSALDFGLAQLGYDRYLDSNRLLDALDSTNQAESDAARKMLTDAYQMYTALQSGGGGDALKAMMGNAGMNF